MFSGIGGSEILVVVLVVLILFGSKRIPDFAQGLGRVTRGIRKAVDQIRDEIDKATPLEPPGQGPKAG
jgi:sec-independent protein translocase protein TatA